MALESSRTGCERTVPGLLSRISAPSVSIFESAGLGLSHLGRYARKVHQLQPKPKTIDELKVAMGSATTRTHQQGSGKLHQAPTMPARLPMAVNSSICSNSVHLQVCILISAPKPGSFQSHPHTTGESSVRIAKTEINFLQGK